MVPWRKAALADIVESLSKETANQRQASVSPQVINGLDPISSLQRTLFAPVLGQMATGTSNDTSSGNGWSDLDQLLGFSGNVDFPYFPGNTANVQSTATVTDPGFPQWTDLFSGLATTNGWDDGAMNNSEVGDAGMMNAWHDHSGSANNANQYEPEGRVDDFFHHVASALGG